MRTRGTKSWGGVDRFELTEDNLIDSYKVGFVI